MAPCKIAIVLPEERLDLVIPFDTSLTFAAGLVSSIIARASKHSSVPLTLSPDSIQLRLNGVDGFIVDQDDKVEDVMTAADILFVTTPSNTNQSAKHAVSSTANTCNGRFRIRVITPLAAQRHGDFRHIPLLKNGFEFSANLTLREIKSEVANHLGLRSDDSVLETPLASTIDLHTAESPIETSNLDLTVGTAHLLELAVNGVLSIYAVERKTDGDTATNQIGKDAMFKAAPHWEIPSVQSDRATAAFLSCFRVFSHVAGAEDFTEMQQNELLRLYHLLTAFPPAVRAMHILIDGKTLRPSECAALIQCTSAILQDLIPKNIIDNDSRRALEGTRLLLGLILQRSAKLEKKSKEDAPETSKATHPYLTSYYTVDLRDVQTQEPVRDPVQTNFGLVDRSTYEAPGRHVEGNLQIADNPDVRALRVAVLFGGVAPESPYYDSDILMAQYLRSSASSAAENLAKDLKQFSRDLLYLAMLCEETQMTVTAPKLLSGSRHPCLTLDRQGYVAVYTGTPPCAPPDRDKAIYRPLSGTEENIDANIVAQVLEPILRSRQRDGTAVFDLFSTSARKAASSTELLVFCVDCSKSMDDSSNFSEINDTYNYSNAQEDVDMEMEEEENPLTLNEIKDWLSSHESYNDILALVHSATTSQSRTTAKEVVTFLCTLASREIAHLAKKMTATSSWASRGYLRSHRNGRSDRISALRRTLSALNVYEDALCDLIVFKAKESGFRPEAFAWGFHDAIPSLPSPPVTRVDLTEEYTVPQEYICPISQTVFKDPVTTADGFTFERRSIERWYRIRHSSPLTGLTVSNTELRRNQQLFDQIQNWTQGQDILQALPSTPKRTRWATSTRAASGVLLTFIGPTGTFSRTLRLSSTLADVHKLAFRGMRGMHTSFDLHFSGRRLVSSDSTLQLESITSGSEIIVTATPEIAAAASNNADGGLQDMCLIKIYTPDTREIYEDFSYWVPSNTSVSLAAVVFKFWRYHLRYWYGRHKVYDREIWSKLRYGGDGTFIGDRHSTWEALAPMISQLVPTESVASEAMCKAGEADDQSLNARGTSLWNSDDDLDNEDEHGSGSTNLPSRSRRPLHRVLKLEIGSYRSPEDLEAKRQEKLRTLTRMGISKQIFGSFVNRLIAYNYPTAVGLVTFGTKTNLSLPLTDTVENFRSAIDNMETAGDTSLWDALALAADQLINPDALTSPTVRKRIICLSDGHDTKSSRRVQDVCRLLVQHSIVVDSCSIGNEDNSDLRTVSYLTGGYKFVPRTLEDAVAVCELEPVLSLYERPPVTRPMIPAMLTASAFSLAIPMAQADPVSRDVFPTRKSHPNINDTFVRIKALERMPSAAPINSAETTASSLRTRRLLSEIRDIAAHPHPSYDVYVSEANMGFWKVVIAGPTESAYATGTFVIYLDFGEDYPRNAPNGRFVTPIFHPNINRHGRICHSIFDRNWTLDTTSRSLLDTVFGLMLVPEFTDPINTVVTLDYYWDEVAFKAEVEKHIAKHAGKGREELGRLILGEDEGVRN